MSVIPEGKRVALYLGDSLKKSKQCLSCGLIYKVKPSRYDRSKTCSRKCADSLKSKLGTEKRSCKFCGKEYFRCASRAKHGRGSVCSKDCQYKLARMVAENSPKKITFSCMACGVDFKINKSSLNNKLGAGKYCSRTCRDRHRVNKNHPMYIHGSASEKRGPNWQSQKRSAKKRDGYKCQCCGVPEIEHLESIGDALHVHHIRPFRLFDSFIEANKLENLITLCAPCHRAADAEIQRLERIHANDNRPPDQAAKQA